MTLSRQRTGQGRVTDAVSFRGLGVDHVILDDGTIADDLRDLVPGGVDGAVGFVGANVLRDALQATRTGGTVCFIGMFSDQWTIHDFYPMGWLPNGVRLTAYFGEASDLTTGTLQAFLDAVAACEAVVPVGRLYQLDQIVQAHHDFEHNSVGGKGVVLVSTDDTLASPRQRRREGDPRPRSYLLMRRSPGSVIR